MSSDTSPRVSVCVLTYNHGQYIEQALRGVLQQQTDFPFEIVLLDDCSTDDTRRVATDILQDSGVRHRVLSHAQNLGVGASFLELLQSARGEYVAFLEGDDFWSSPTKLAEQVAILDASPELSGCFGRAMVIDHAGAITGEYFAHHRARAPQADIDQRHAISHGASGPACTYMYRRSVTRPMPDWFRSAASHQALMVLLTRRGSVRFIDRDWGRYRIHSGGVWSSAPESQRILKDLRFVLALAGAPELATRYPRALLKRLGLTVVSLARARAVEIVKKGR